LADATDVSPTWFESVPSSAPSVGKLARCWVLSRSRQGDRQCVGGLGGTEPYSRIHWHHLDNRLTQTSVVFWNHGGESDVEKGSLKESEGRVGLGVVPSWCAEYIYEHPETRRGWRQQLMTGISKECHGRKTERRVNSHGHGQSRTGSELFAGHSGLPGAVHLLAVPVEKLRRPRPSLVANSAGFVCYMSSRTVTRRPGKFPQHKSDDNHEGFYRLLHKKGDRMRVCHRKPRPEATTAILESRTA